MYTNVLGQTLMVTKQAMAQRLVSIPVWTENAMSILIIAFERRRPVLDLCNRTQNAAVMRTSPAAASTFTVIESALREGTSANV